MHTSTSSRISGSLSLSISKPGRGAIWYHAVVRQDCLCQIGSGGQYKWGQGNKYPEEQGVLNKYVNPGGGAKLTDAATAIHGLYLTSPSIATAKKMPQVWAQFVSWVDANVNSDKVAVVIPYNSETCNLK